ncbi:MAG: isochorismatase family protein [Actinomycetota bacterium]|nr:isochorismatase family protein [Actinomycetota bacterium]
MTVTALDPITALIAIDLQKGITAMPVEPSPASVIGHTVELLEAFRAHGLPVVLVNVDAGAPGRTEAARDGGGPTSVMRRPGWTELVPELNAQPSDHRVTKKTWGAFHGTGLNQHLRELGVTQVVIAGIATSAGVESTARQAHELGFHVTLATDAMTDRESATHAHSIEKIFPRLGETGTTAEILELLEGAR